MEELPGLVLGCTAVLMSLLVALPISIVLLSGLSKGVLHPASRDASRRAAPKH